VGGPEAGAVSSSGSFDLGYIASITRGERRRRSECSKSGSRRHACGNVWHRLRNRFFATVVTSLF